MIALVADDFSGAAEMAGIALQYGLSVALSTNGSFENPDADLLIISTDSRSMNLSDAMEATELAIRILLDYKPDWLFKKVDSVLRGHVLAELGLQMDLLNCNKAILAPANPSLKRSIQNGIYYVDGAPIAETSFAHDPDFAIKSSQIKEMLGNASSRSWCLIDADATIPEKGIAVAEVKSTDSLDVYCSKISPQVALAGAGDFFEALLRQSYSPVLQKALPNIGTPCLYVSGTTFRSRVEELARLADETALVHYIDDISTPAKSEGYVKRVAQSLKEKGKAVIATNPNYSHSGDKDLRELMAETVFEVLAHATPRELVIEGGATAAAILSRLNVHNFRPLNQVSRGIIRMRAERAALYITVKPGSYKMPEIISGMFN